MPKRANGEGSVYRRKDGRFVASITLPDGRRKELSAPSQRAARERLRDAQTALAKHQPIHYSSQTLADYLPEWLEGRRPRLAASTAQRYEELTRIHVLPALGRLTLARLGPQQLQTLYADRLAAGSSPRTVAYIHAMLHAALGQALRWQLVPRNVADAVSPPRPKRREMQTLSAEQAATLLEAASGDRLAALYVLALTTGMRQGEILALRWQAVDLEAATLTVRASLRKLKGQGFVFGETKTAGSRRAVPLSAPAVAALRRHRALQAAERLKAGSAWQELDLVFATESGGPIDAIWMLRHAFRPLLKRAGLPRIRFHDLRHTAATLMLEKGVPLKVVAELLGHKSIVLTANTYLHPDDAMIRSAVDAMDRLFSDRVAGAVAGKTAASPKSP